MVLCYIIGLLVNCRPTAFLFYLMFLCCVVFGHRCALIALDGFKVDSRLIIITNFQLSKIIFGRWCLFSFSMMLAPFNFKPYLSTTECNPIHSLRRTHMAVVINTSLLRLPYHLFRLTIEFNKTKLCSWLLLLLSSLCQG